MISSMGKDHAETTCRHGTSAVHAYALIEMLLPALLSAFLCACYRLSSRQSRLDGTGDMPVDDGSGDWVEDAFVEPDLPDEVEMPLEVLDVSEEAGLDLPDVLGEVELPPDLAWVTVPAGTFEMGCSPGDVDCWSDGREEPRHTVNVPAFEVTGTEITQAQYEAVTGGNPSYFTGCPDCPVERVTWHEAKALCNAIGGRLPYEAEWEYAARAGTTTRYYCGDDPACLDHAAWYIANSGSTTHPVGEKTDNAFGLFDVLGNVWEWVEDCWHWDYTGAPTDGGVWSGGDCTYRMLRGGSWNTYDVFLGVSSRRGYEPDGRDRGIGFRCARDL